MECRYCHKELSVQDHEDSKKKGYGFIHIECRKEEARKRAIDFYYKHRDVYITRASKWNKTNKERHNSNNKASRDALKEEVFKHYSPNLVCQKCGFSDMRALEMDHIQGRRTGKKKDELTGVHLYRWIKQHNFPKGFQVLCSNCQKIKIVEEWEYRWNYRKENLEQSSS